MKWMAQHWRGRGEWTHTHMGNVRLYSLTGEWEKAKTCLRSFKKIILKEIWKIVLTVDSEWGKGEDVCVVSWHSDDFEDAVCINTSCNHPALLPAVGVICDITLNGV